MEHGRLASVELFVEVLERKYLSASRQASRLAFKCAYVQIHILQRIRDLFQLLPSCFPCYYLLGQVAAGGGGGGFF
jgi:hypothetical protein